jgi:hypothetical protein
LPKTINATFPLLMARWVPRQVIVNDRVEEMLQVDAFREAVGGNKNSLLSLNHGFDTSAAILRSEKPGDNIDAQLWKCLAEPCCDMLCRCDESAKQYGIDFLSKYRPEKSDDGIELGIGSACEPLGLLNQSTQLSVVSNDRSGFDIEAVRFVFIAQLFFENIHIIEASAERAQGGRRRGSDAAHKRQGTPERKPATVLILAGAFDNPKAVIEYRIMEGLVVTVEPINFLSAQMLRKRAFLAPLAPGDVNAPALDEVPSQAPAADFIFEGAT